MGYAPAPVEAVRMQQFEEDWPGMFRLVYHSRPLQRLPVTAVTQLPPAQHSSPAKQNKKKPCSTLPLNHFGLAGR